MQKNFFSSSVGRDKLFPKRLQFRTHPPGAAGPPALHTAPRLPGLIPRRCSRGAIDDKTMTHKFTARNAIFTRRSFSLVLPGPFVEKQHQSDVKTGGGR